MARPIRTSSEPMITLSSGEPLTGQRHFREPEETLPMYSSLKPPPYALTQAAFGRSLIRQPRLSVTPALRRSIGPTPLSGEPVADVRRPQHNLPTDLRTRNFIVRCHSSKFYKRYRLSIKFIFYLLCVVLVATVVWLLATFKFS